MAHDDTGEAIDERVATIQAVWSRGNYAAIGDLFAPAGAALAEELAATVGLAGQDVLDVATGTGVTAMALARHGARVIGVDLTPALIDEARRRRSAAGLAITFDLADFLDLPYEDGRFAVVTSTLGVMLADDPSRCAKELARVCAPGGTIATTAWSRDGWIGRLDDTVRARHPELADRRGADICAWVETDTLHEWFAGTDVVLEDVTMREIDARFPDLEGAWRFWEEHGGPIQSLRDAVTERGGDWAATRRAIIEAWRPLVRQAEDGIILPMRYGRALFHRVRTR